MNISQIDTRDFEQILALNEAAVPNVNLIGHKELQWFVDNAACVYVAKIDDRIAGFLIGLRPGSNYASPNYQWFCDNYEDFAYVDRVTVAEWARRQGIAESLYKVFAESQSDAPVITCEINLRPPNAGSMRFHERMGFRKVGSQEIEGGTKEVALMEKTL